MPPLPPSNTQRLWVAYNDGVNDHKLMLRGDTDATPADLMDVANDFLVALADTLYAISIKGAEHALAGTNVANPVVWSGSSGYGTQAMPAVNAPREFALEFRSNDGRLGSYSMWGINSATPPTYRVAFGLVTDLDAARAVLIGAHNVGTLCTISGLRGVFKTYWNVNFNSYWEENARG